MYKTTLPVIFRTEWFDKEKTLKQIKKVGAERITLSLAREIEHKFSSPEILEKLAEYIKFFKENGLEIIVWLGETLGHTRREPIPGADYTFIRQLSGGKIYAMCPKDKNFTADFCSWVQKVAMCGADMIMLDDDFRLTTRGGSMGCCCDLHMEAMRKELGEDIRVEDLKKLVFSGGPNKYRKAWLKVQKDSMVDFAKAIRAALDEVNPDVRLNFCGVCDWYLNGGGTIDIIKAMAGNTKPFIRTMGAPYWQRPLGEIIEYERMQAHWLSNEEIEVFSEGDTFPRPRFATAASKLECFDTALRADGTNDGILKYVFDIVSDAEYETGYVDAAAKNKWLHDEIDRLFDGKKAVGLRPYNNYNILETEYLPENADNIDYVLNYFYCPSAVFTTVNSLPTAFDGNGVNVIFGENARHIDVDDLKNGSIIDVKAAQIFTSMGIDVGLEKIIDKEEYITKGFSDWPREDFPEEDRFVRLDATGKYEIVETKVDAKVLSYVIFGGKRSPLAYIYENADGMRFLVYAFVASDSKKIGWMHSYSRRRQIVSKLSWLGKAEDNIYIDGNYPYMYILAKRDDNSMSVGLWNLFEDVAENVRVKIGTEKYKDIEFVNCTGHIEGDTVIIESTIIPYSFAGFNLK